MGFAARMDEFGKPAWIAAMVLGFIWWWPVGLAVLAVRLATKRRWQMQGGPGRWYSAANGAPAGAYGGGGFATGGCGTGKWGWGATPSSGNAAFDDYRSETIRRLEDEQKEFQAFLARLRAARDKAEFDQFMAERRQVNPTAG